MSEENRKPNLWLLFSLLFFIAENCYFGWNRQPCCNAERYCDLIYQFSFIMGAINYAKNGIRKMIHYEIGQVLSDTNPKRGEK